MIAIDTNLLARLVLADDQAQAKIASDLIDRNACYVPVTVFIELAWILWGVFKPDPDRRQIVARTLTGILSVENLHFQDEGRIHNALRLFSQEGLGIADALHHALSDGCQLLVTFDAAFSKKAQALRLSPPVALPPE
jgi:predicted nucleic-acid-binding protein